MTANFAGFWSYVHADDRNVGGRILSLADRLAETFELLSAERLELFVDRELKWGEEWERRIQEELQRTTFFIPLITPAYFRSEACRKELLDFARAAKEFGVEQLLMPIYYVSVAELDAADDPSDEAMALVRKAQWIDLRDVRLEDEASSEHRTLVDGLAKRLLEIAEEVEAKPASAPAAEGPQGEPAASPAEGSTEGDDGEVEGSLELLAKGEAALPLWNETVEEIGGVFQEIGGLTEESVAEMEAENTSGGGTFATRLATANRFAQRLDDPADRLVQLGSEYVARLLEVDPAVQTLVKIAHENPEVADEQGVIDLFRSIKGLTVASRDAMQNAAQFADILEQNAGFSRELRRPLKRMQGAIRNIVDAQSILDDWEEQIDGLDESDPDAD